MTTVEISDLISSILWSYLFILIIDAKWDISDKIRLSIKKSKNKYYPYRTKEEYEEFFIYKPYPTHIECFIDKVDELRHSEGGCSSICHKAHCMCNTSEKPFLVWLENFNNKNEKNYY